MLFSKLLSPITTGLFSSTPIAPVLAPVALPVVAPVMTPVIAPLAPPVIAPISPSLGNLDLDLNLGLLGSTSLSLDLNLGAGSLLSADLDLNVDLFGHDVLDSQTELDLGGGGEAFLDLDADADLTLFGGDLLDLEAEADLELGGDALADLDLDADLALLEGQLADLEAEADLELLGDEVVDADLGLDLDLLDPSAGDPPTEATPPPSSPDVPADTVGVTFHVDPDGDGAANEYYFLWKSDAAPEGQEPNFRDYLEALKEDLAEDYPGQDPADLVLKSTFYGPNGEESYYYFDGTEFNEPSEAPEETGGDGLLSLDLDVSAALGGDYWAEAGEFFDSLSRDVAPVEDCEQPLEEEEPEAEACL